MEIIVTDVEDMIYLRSVIDTYQYYPNQLTLKVSSSNPIWIQWKDILFPNILIQKSILQLSSEKKDTSQHLSYYIEQTYLRKLKIQPKSNSTHKSLILFLHPSIPIPSSFWNSLPSLQFIFIFGDSTTPISIPYKQILPIRIQDYRQPQFYDNLFLYPHIFHHIISSLQSHFCHSLNWIPFGKKIENKRDKMWEYLNELCGNENIVLEEKQIYSLPKIQKSHEIILKEERSIEEEYQILHELKPSEKLSYYQKMIEPKLKKREMKIEKKEEIKKEIIPPQKIEMKSIYILPLFEYSIFTFLWTLLQTNQPNERPEKIYISKTKLYSIENSNLIYFHFIKNIAFKKIYELGISIEMYIDSEDPSIQIWNSDSILFEKKNLMKWKNWIGMKESYEMEISIYYICMDGLLEIPTFMWEKKNKILILKNQDKNEVIEEMKSMKEFDIYDMRFMNQYHGYIGDSYFEIMEREFEYIIQAKEVYGYRENKKRSFYDFVMEFR